MVRKEILGETERQILEEYLKGKRMKGYQTVLWRIRNIGLKEIVLGCERDLQLLRKLARKEKVSLQDSHRLFSDEDVANAKGERV